MKDLYHSKQILNGRHRKVASPERQALAIPEKSDSMVPWQKQGFTPRKWGKNSKRNLERIDKPWRIE